MMAQAREYTQKAEPTYICRPDIRVRAGREQRAFSVEGRAWSGGVVGHTRHLHTVGLGLLVMLGPMDRDEGKCEREADMVGARQPSGIGEAGARRREEDSGIAESGRTGLAGDR